FESEVQRELADALRQARCVVVPGGRDMSFIALGRRQAPVVMPRVPPARGLACAVVAGPLQPGMGVVREAQRVVMPKGGEGMVVAGYAPLRIVMPVLAPPGRFAVQEQQAVIVRAHTPHRDRAQTIAMPVARLVGVRGYDGVAHTICVLPDQLGEPRVT